MYCPARLAQTDTSALHALIAAHPLAMLVSSHDGLPDADHLPFELVTGGAHGILRAHVARANPVWRRAGQPVLAVFRGASGYVTPDRVEKAQNGGRVVPTWAYDVVHLHGTLRTIDDPAWLRTLVARQTDRHEAAQLDPWSVTDAPHAYTEALLKAIVGIEIVVERIEGKWKREPMRQDIAPQK
ncbi:FMN-binding negative transcriptional regulator [Massilia sp.]|uniref:FMN-binding negative transcriptional regulator n=1 Tax=Massilia sp. TaxID=1882437 RepID=UPI00289BB822|nr:FMN-binding negative transcriptional regulator [Massilia sp.]